MLGIVYNATGSMWLGILACIVTGTICGALNGIVLTKFTELAPMIVTLATNIIYRGLSERILGDGSTGGMTSVSWFTDIFYGRLFKLIPYPIIIFMVIIPGKCKKSMRITPIRWNHLAWMNAGWM